VTRDVAGLGVAGAKAAGHGVRSGVRYAGGGSARKSSPTKLPHKAADTTTLEARAARDAARDAKRAQARSVSRLDPSFYCSYQFLSFHV
jgi:hypothetical protein